MSDDWTDEEIDAVDDAALMRALCDEVDRLRAAVKDAADRLEIEADGGHPDQFMIAVVAGELAAALEGEAET